MLEVGSIVNGLVSSEPVEITGISPYPHGKFYVKWIGKNSSMGRSRMLTQAEIDALEIVAKESSVNFTGDPEKFVLFAEAERIHATFRFINMRYYIPKRHILFLGIIFGSLLLACSDNANLADSDFFDKEEAWIKDSTSSSSILSSSSQEGSKFLGEDSIASSSSSSKIIDSLSFDYSEYPYAGLPRIVIETENFQEIQDRDTEISAKLQIWGEDSPESEILSLTIKGRGNTSWDFPKKPYAIEFDEKQSLLGMAEAKKWVLLANYLDRTLVRNAVAFEIAKRTNLEWSPSGKFAEVFLNGKFLGNYFICEKIQISKNRLNINKESYLLEFDTYYDEEVKFRTSINDLPVNIKNPDISSEEQLTYIVTYIDTVECILYGDCSDFEIENYLDLQSFADYLIVYELTENTELTHPKSAYMYKDSGLLKAGPVWDFDWGTFIENKLNGWRTNSGIWYSALFENQTFKEILRNNWIQYKSALEEIPQYIDSLASYTKESNDRNIALWPIDTQALSFPDKDKSFEEALSMMKAAYSTRLNILDLLITSLDCKTSL
jgi:hypothetical protein